MNNGQTACLVAVAQNVAEESWCYQYFLRNLTRKAKRTDKNNESGKDTTAKQLRIIWNFYSSKTKIYKDFSNKNQSIGILDAKVMVKTSQFGQNKSQLN